MKKQFTTDGVTTTILDSAARKINVAIKQAKDGIADFDIAQQFLEQAKKDLYLLESIFFCEQEPLMAIRVKEIYVKLTTGVIVWDDVLPVGTECFGMIRKLEYDIVKELEQAE